MYANREVQTLNQQISNCKINVIQIAFKMKRNKWRRKTQKLQIRQYAFNMDSNINALDIKAKGTRASGNCSHATECI